MKAMRDAWADALIGVAEIDKRVLVMDGDLATSTRVDRFANRLPDQFIQMGIAEQNMVGAAAGLASMGYVPWLSSFAVFLTHRALDPIRMLVAQTHANVKIGAGYSGLLTGSTGKTHQDVEDLAIMRAMPGMVVLAPGDATECAAMVEWAMDYVGPVYLRLTRDPSADLLSGDVQAFRDGKVRRLREGQEVALLSTGAQSSRTLEAAQLLEGSGLNCSVLHVPRLKPIDAADLHESVGGAQIVVTVEEHSVLGGLGGLVSELFGGMVSAPLIHRIGLQDTWGESAPNDFLLDRYGLSAVRVADAVRELVL